MYKLQKKDLNLETLLIFLTVICIFAYRIIVSDALIDWDEELYFQIAKHWQWDSTIPYRDIFDHKPPFLYLYIKTFSLWGSSLAIFRIFQSALLLISIFYLWKTFQKSLSILIVPALYGFLSILGSEGTNSEIIYIPFLILSLCLIKKERLIYASIFMALAVSIKYTTVFDLLGIVSFLFIIKTPFKNILYSTLLSIVAFIVINSLFFLYFIQFDINIIDITILKNIAHSAGERTFSIGHENFTDKFSDIFSFGIFILAFSYFYKSLSSLTHLKRYSIGLVIWMIFSYIQAKTTGKDYYHYFVPMFVPLFILVSYLYHGISESYKKLATGLICLFVINHFIYTAPEKYDIYKERKELLEEQCLPDFHYHGYWLNIYRICDVKPLKYMFTPFYEVEHFSGIAGSGGIEWTKSIKKPVIFQKDKKSKSFKIYPDGEYLYLNFRTDNKFFNFLGDDI